MVETIEHHIEDGLSPRDAARKAMTDGGALVGIALVLCSVFIPTAFISGITGQFFGNSLTIAVSTAICAQLAYAFWRCRASPPVTGAEGFISTLIDGLLGWFFKGFNKAFAWSSNAYGNTIARLTRLAIIVLLIRRLR